MKTVAIALLVSFLPAAAQNLTPAQKDADFRYLASLYSTYYAPYDWKKQLFGFDSANLKPWLERVAASRTDLDFYEICVEYVAGLNDTHDAFSLPSDFVARLGFGVDVYDGLVVIEGIDRTALPAAKYPFAAGDELVSVDGQPVEELLKAFAKYAVQSNPISTRRLAAARIATRPQFFMPHAADLGDMASVVIQRRNGAIESYSIPWQKTGTPIEVGPVPSPRTASAKKSAVSALDDGMAEVEKARFSGVLEPELTGLTGYGARNPIFLNGFPAGKFTRRLGGDAADFFYSGTFKWDELTIGYIRIPNYSPPSQTVALQQFDREIAFMNANTNGLIVDEMRNTGGNLCFGESIATRLIPYKFHATGFVLRPFWARVVGFYNAMIAAKAAGAPQEQIDLYEMVYKEMLSANQQGRRLTTELPICTASLDREPLKDRDGNILAYQKPVMMLIDEFTTSTADSVAGMFQDAGRGVLFGMRTNGAGGNNTAFSAGTYSEGSAGLTLALQTRRAPIRVEGYPDTAYIENVGVQPDVTVDYMRRDNLLQNGAPFIDHFLQAMAAYVRGPRQTSDFPNPAVVPGDR
jgi:C-terminal processing protease CtpA/Prc